MNCTVYIHIAADNTARLWGCNGGGEATEDILVQLVVFPDMDMFHNG